MKTDLEAFNITISLVERAAAHLLTMPRQCADVAGSCQYRGENGNMCAIGKLIPDENYLETMEGQGVLSRDVHVAIPELGILDERQQGRAALVLGRLQDLHDGHSLWNRLPGAPHSLRPELVAKKVRDCVAFATSLFNLPTPPNFIMVPS